MSNQTFEKLFDDKGNRVDGYFFDPSNDIIHFIKSIDGKPIKFSTGVKRPKIAQAKKVAGRKLKEKLGLTKAKHKSLLGDELDLWLKVKESEGLKYDTLNNIRRAHKQLKEFWGDRFCHEINLDVLPEFYDWWSENYKDLQMENAVKYLRNFARYLATKVVNGAPLLAAVPKIKDPNYSEIRAQRKKKKEMVIHKEDLKKILENADFEDDSLLARDRQTLALIMYTMATRITETLTMRFGEEILMSGARPRYRWTIGQNKADLYGEHEFPEILASRLLELYERRKKEGTNYLFPQKLDNRKALKSQQVNWEEWRKKASIGFHWTPHTMRHSCLTHLFNDEKNPQALILKLYRVSLAVALETYVKVTKSGIEKMRESIEVPEWN